MKLLFSPTFNSLPMQISFATCSSFPGLHILGSNTLSSTSLRWSLPFPITSEWQEEKQKPHEYNEPRWL